jgi:hypothetical protein
MIHSLESILDVYPNEIGRIKTKDLPSYTQIDKFVEENNVSLKELLFFKISSEEFVVVLKHSK